LTQSQRPSHRRKPRMKSMVQQQSHWILSEKRTSDTGDLPFRTRRSMIATGTPAPVVEFVHYYSIEIGRFQPKTEP